MQGWLSEKTAQKVVHYPNVEYSRIGIFKDTKNIGKNESDRKYFLSMQVLLT